VNSPTPKFFSLVELLVVLVVMALVFGLALPRLLRFPQRLLVDNLRSQTQSAFRNASTRALMSGNSVTLVLNPEQNQFRIQSESGASLDAATPAASGETGETGGKSRLLAMESTYSFHRGIVWDPETAPSDAESPAQYVFHPNGEAGGPLLKVKAGKREFQIEVDSLTGRPLFMETTQP
jgi:type II secretory pathway pseudopilin PulG